MAENLVRRVSGLRRTGERAQQVVLGGKIVQWVDEGRREHPIFDHFGAVKGTICAHPAHRISPASETLAAGLLVVKDWAAGR